MYKQSEIIIVYMRVYYIKCDDEFIHKTPGEINLENHLSIFYFGIV